MALTVHTDDDRRSLCEAVGVAGVEQLFAAIPPSLRQKGLELPPGLSESETRRRVEGLASLCTPPHEASFLGAGCYRHYVPSAVRALVSRGEFATSYTPYQAEVSQGTLQHIFEFQTCVCELTGLDVANASLYDGPTALAEAAFMALRLTGREAVAASAGVHPETLHLLETYAAGPGVSLLRWPLEAGTGLTPACTGPLSPEIGAVLVQQPNYLGFVEDLEPLAEAAHVAGALLVVSANPSTLGVLEAPGRQGADIVVGDAQVFGSPPSYGGPSAGFLACGSEHVRQMPGRLVGQTIDADGRVCYALTLQTREQHIRRAKATSNICSNQALSALAATIHLALLGPQGLRERAEICLQRAHYLQGALCELPGIEPFASGPFFAEFALSLPCPAETFASAMRDRGIDPGVPLSRLKPAVRSPMSGSPPAAADPTRDDNVLLVAVTEVNPPEALDRYATAAQTILAALPAGLGEARR